MKKKLIILIFIICIILIGLVIIFKNKGNTSNVRIISKKSQIYSKDDIDSAIAVTQKYFKENFEGCSLLEIGYIGDQKNNTYLDKASDYNKEQVIVLTSNFYVSPSGGDGSLNQDFQYKNWIWILVRNKNENWEHVDHGY